MNRDFTTLRRFPPPRPASAVSGLQSDAANWPKKPRISDEIFPHEMVQKNCFSGVGIEGNLAD